MLETSSPYFVELAEFANSTSGEFLLLAEPGMTN